MLCMVSSCHAKFFVNSAQRSTCSEQRDHLTRHVVTCKNFKNVRPKSGGSEVTYEKWSFTSSSNYCERFEPRSHFISRLSMIVQVNLVLNRTIFVDSD